MTANDEVRLRPVEAAEHDRFFELFERYDAELGPHDPDRPADQTPASYTALYREAVERDREGQTLEWIELAAAPVGLLVWRQVPDWPDERREVAEILDCYVEPPSRRAGVASTAIGLWLAARRDESVELVEAGVLSGNREAVAFWESLGFEVRAFQTVRRL